MNEMFKKYEYFPTIILLNVQSFQIFWINLEIYKWNGTKLYCYN